MLSALEGGELAFFDEEFDGAGVDDRSVGGAAALEVEAGVLEPEFVMADSDIGAFEVGAAVAERPDFGAGQNEAGKNFVV